MKDKKYCLGFFGLLMASSFNLLLKNSLFLSIPFPVLLTVLTLSFLIPFFIIHLTNKFNKFKYLSMGILIYILMATVPLEILKIIFINNPHVYKGLYTTGHIISSRGIREFLVWAFNYSLGLDVLSSLNYQVILYTIISLFTGIYFSKVLKEKGKMIYIVLPISIFYLQWLRYVDKTLILFNYYLIGVVGCYLTIDYSRRIKLLQKRRDIDYKFYNYKGLVTTGFVVVAILVLITNGTVNIFYMSGINEKLSQRFPPVLNVRRVDTGRNVYSSIFNNNLGGTIEQDQDTVIMVVESNRGNLYLRGRVKETYTGYSWKDENSDKYKETMNTFYSNDILFKDNENKVTITVYPHNKEDTRIYAPYLPVSVNMDKKVFYNDNLEMFFKKGIVNIGKISYRVTSIIPRYDAGKKEYNIIDSREIEKDLYLQLPKDLPQRIVEHAQGITQGYDGDYDKMKALEGYLRKNYKYSLNVSDVPKGADFVDYFLFEDKKGYCTYYASALAVMGRAIGIPTRYVEGFILQGEGNDGVYEITGDKAHAWVEAYIDKVGWIPFEPTSSYPIENEEDRVEEEGTSVSNRRSQNSYGDLKRRIEEEINPIVGDGDYNYEVSKERVWFKWIGPSIILVLLLVIVLRIVYLKINYRIFFSQGSNKKKIIRMYHLIAALYSNIDNDIAMNPPYLLLRNLQKNLLDKNINDDIINIINKAMYSREEMSGEDFKTIQEFVQKFEKAVIKKIGIGRYYFQRYIIGDIHREIVKLKL